MKSKIDTDKLFTLLPANLKDSDLLSLEAKKVLSALLYWCIISEARNTGRIFISNNQLCSIAGVSKSTIQEVAAFEFNKYDLARKIAGKPKASRNDIGQASEWIINWNKLEQPLKEASFGDRFSDLMKPSENPMSTPYHYISSHSISSHGNVTHSNLSNDNSYNLIEDNFNETHFTASQSSEMQDNLFEDIPTNDNSKANISISTPVEVINKNEEKTISSINEDLEVENGDEKKTTEEHILDLPF